MAQPDIQALGDALGNISDSFRELAISIDNSKEQINLIEQTFPPNVSERLDLAMNRIKGLKLEQAGMKEVQKKHNTQIHEMRGHIRGILKEQIRLDMNQLARMANFNAHLGNGTLVALKGVGNTQILDFPMSILELNAIDDSTVDNLIKALGIFVPADATMATKRAALSYYIGVQGQ